MDGVQILILALAAYSAIALWRLATALQRNWDGQFEDLLEEEAIVRRLAMAGLSVACLLAAILLRGSVRDLLAYLSG
ncbi:hypothetical protein KPL78_21730 [Roseomonas sp. HJA6]|uniref:DUF1146 domain-containing protein n=1 Tax=Roseomonas alba TaxID=2846776 RepID=A0ABS7ADW4_9PROT|nr:hypothetical protein [Neoroseomonas alba]MBW6400495.1 hypothetical protein [Neoroseomonas alba]